jgi:hypothetical protein
VKHQPHPSCSPKQRGASTSRMKRNETWINSTTSTWCFCSNVAAVRRSHACVVPRVERQMSGGIIRT